MNCEEACNIDWPSWLTAVGTIALAILAVFQDRIREWLQKPRLDLRITAISPDAVKTPTTIGDHLFDAYWFRIRISNNGNLSARQVEVLAQQLERRTASGDFEIQPWFQPMNLIWAHVRAPFIEAISPGTFKFCDLFFVGDPKIYAVNKLGAEHLGGDTGQTTMTFQVISPPFNKSHLVSPGIYRLHVVVAANNAPVLKKTLEINHTGKWFSDPEAMAVDGIGFRVL
jgi:hypothetical protein